MEVNAAATAAMMAPRPIFLSSSLICMLSLTTIIEWTETLAFGTGAVRAVLTFGVLRRYVRQVILFQEHQDLGLEHRHIYPHLMELVERKGRLTEDRRHRSPKRPLACPTIPHCCASSSFR